MNSFVSERRRGSLGVKHFHEDMPSVYRVSGGISRIVAVLIAVVIILLITTAYGFLNTSMSTTLTNTQTATTVSTTTVSQYSVSCVQTGPEQNVFVRLVSVSNESPVSNAFVYGTFYANCGGIGEDAPFPMQTSRTNSSGMSELQIIGCACSFGNYSVSVEYNNTMVSSIDFSPSFKYMAQTAVVSIGFPSGKVSNITISCALVGAITTGTITEC